MIRRIITIDEDRCNGCGACAAACHEGAIEIIDGKARLIRDDYCDGLGDCLPECPAGAISFEEREAPAYNGAAVAEAKKRRSGEREKRQERRSKLKQWPCQIKLVPVSAPYFHDAELLLGAILKNHNIKSITLLRMEVPCCGGLELAVKKALESSKKQTACQVATISVEGNILKEEEKHYV